jgi:cyclopropane fatty-acyl-phospholipid synthase-like methyltransferase
VIEANTRPMHNRPPVAQFDTEQIRRYYDRNTSSFVALGQGGSAGSIHRAVWGPGTTTREQAFHVVEDRIADVVRRVAERSAHVVDLGCGVGAGLCYLAGLLPITGTGVTLSPVQVRVARERIESAGLSGRVACIEGDYGDLPSGMQTADVAYAIESFVHGPDPAHFFAEAARLVRPGGALVICDDVRRRAGGRKAERAIHRFTRGWHVNSLLEAGELQSLAGEAGFEHDSTEDLSSYLELGRPRDRVIDAAVAIFGRLPLGETRFGPLIGGSALQKSLAGGWIGYDLMTFTRGT